MSRSLKKGAYVSEPLLKKINKLSESKSKSIILTLSRDSTIIPEMIGYTFSVHNGRKHIPIYINENMVGHKLGEFSFTRLFKNHPGNK